MKLNNALLLVALTIATLTLVSADDESYALRRRRVKGEQKSEPSEPDGGSMDDEPKMKKTKEGKGKVKGSGKKMKKDPTESEGGSMDDMAGKGSKKGGTKDPEEPDSGSMDEGAKKGGKGGKGTKKGGDGSMDDMSTSMSKKTKKEKTAKSSKGGKGGSKGPKLSEPKVGDSADLEEPTYDSEDMNTGV
jgi:hypothetical protein